MPTSRAVMERDRQPHVDLAPPNAPVVRIVNLMPRETVQFIYEAACARAPMFRASGVVASAGTAGVQSRIAPEHRTSLVLLDFPEVFPWFLALVRRLLPLACRLLVLPPFYPVDTEIQLTAHGEGGFFKQHSDNGTYRLHRRAVSYVYYFGHPSYTFTGGELVFYGPSPWVYHLGQSIIAPKWNSIVFFPSGMSHEVWPVSAPGDFRLGRFTLNGWMSR